MPKHPQPPVDTVVVITVITPNAQRRDQIDRLIDAAFESDPRIRTIRVVGYPHQNPEGLQAVDEAIEDLDRVSGTS